LEPAFDEFEPEAFAMAFDDADVPEDDDASAMKDSRLKLRSSVFNPAIACIQKSEVPS
jgi:hypothetical protein